MSTMRKTKGSGVMPAVMTFWNADESFNQKETERYIQWVLDCGAHSLSVTGSTGENISMSDDEQKKIIECLVKFVDHQVPVYPGTGKYSTAQTIEMTKFAQKCGAEGALVIMPYYLIPHKRAVVNHFKKLREAVGDDFDIILYNNPRFCGYQFEPIELKELAEQGIINGVKLADGRASYIQGMKHYCPDGITALYGHDYEPLPAFFAGADGWLSGLPGIFPKFCVDLFNLCTVQQDAPAARKLWGRCAVRHPDTGNATRTRPHGRGCGCSGPAFRSRYGDRGHRSPGRPRCHLSGSAAHRSPRRDSHNISACFPPVIRFILVLYSPTWQKKR